MDVILRQATARFALEGENRKLADTGVAAALAAIDSRLSAIERQLRHTGRVILRGASGASGSSTFVVGRGGEDTTGVLRRIASRTDNRIYLVEAMVEATVSPNVQIQVHADDGPLVSVPDPALLEAEPLTPSDLGKRLAERFPGIESISLALLARYWLPLAPTSN